MEIRKLREEKAEVLSESHARHKLLTRQSSCISWLCAQLQARDALAAGALRPDMGPAVEAPVEQAEADKEKALNDGKRQHRLATCLLHGNGLASEKVSVPILPKRQAWAQ
jgi:hypothetical protein